MVFRPLHYVASEYPHLLSFRSCVGHIIYGSSNATAQTDYPVRMTISPGINLTPGNANDTIGLPYLRKDFSDLVIVNQWGKRLNHWVEYPTYRTDGKLDVWVKIPTLYQNQTYPIYLFSGHANAGMNKKGTSDHPIYNSGNDAGEPVFTTFDHFDTSNDSTKWDFGQSSRSNSVIRIYAAVQSYSYVRTKTTKDASVVLRVRAKSGHSGYQGSNYYAEFIGGDNTGLYAGHAFLIVYSSASTCPKYVVNPSGYSPTYYDLTWSADTWYTCEVIRTASTTRFYINNTLMWDSGIACTTAAKLCIEVKDSMATGYSSMYADWQLIRKFVDPEPTHGITWKVW